MNTAPAVPPRLAEAFQELCTLGFDARPGYCCCPGCARDRLEVEGGDPRDLVAYHQMDFEQLACTQSTYVTFGRDPDKILEVFRRHHLFPAWSGDPNDRILIHCPVIH